MAHVTANIVQQAFRGRNDDGSETSATWIEATNTDWSQRRDETFRVRFHVGETAGGDPKGPNHVLEYQVNGGGWATVTTTTPVQLTASATVADGTATTQQISAQTFAAGEFDSDGTVADSTYVENEGTENEYCVLIDSTQTAQNDTIELRVSSADQYDFIPSITAIDVLAPLAPTLGPPADDATVDGTTDQTFEWAFNTGGEPGDAQTAFAFERTFGGFIDGLNRPDAGSAGVAWSPDGSLLAVGFAVDTSTKNLYVYDTSDWSDVPGTPSATGWAREPAFSPDGTLLAVGDASPPHIRIYDTATWNSVTSKTLPDDGGSFDFSQNGTWLATGNQGSPPLQVLATSNWATVLAPSDQDNVSDLAFSPDSSMLAVGDDFSSIGASLLVYDTSNWATISGPPIDNGRIRSVSFSSDSTMLAVGYSNITPALEIYNTDDWSQIAGTPSISVEIPAMDYSPDGTKLAIGTDTNSGAQTLLIYDISDWSLVSGVPSITAKVNGVGFDPTSSIVAATLSFVRPSLVVFNFIEKTYWNGTSWQDTEVFIESALEEVTFPADTW